MITGRPFRFLLIVASGWTLVRAAFILPDVSSRVVAPTRVQEASARSPLPAPVPTRLADAPTAARATPTFAAAPKVPDRTGIDLPAAARGETPRPDGGGGGWGASMVDRLVAAQLAFARTPERTIALAAFAAGAGFSAEEMAVAPAHAQGPGDRWSGAAWMLLRRETTLPPSRASRLGGAQAGLRIDYRLAPRSHIDPALYGRVSSALGAPAAAEAAIGFAARPLPAVPVSVAVERRQALSDGGRSDFALLAYGGVSDRAIGPSLRIHGYGQAGVVGVDDRDAFVDGEVRIGTPLRPRLNVGAGVWGGAQPGAARLDIGPQASLAVPMGRHSARIAAEWRERVAGDAQPSSGPAITIGMNF